MSYLQLKHFCVNCSAHFVVCTHHPDLFKLNQTHCPHCGQPGTSIRHTERVDGEIEDLVPGTSPFEGAGNRINPVYFEDCEPKDYLRTDDAPEPTAKVKSAKRLLSKLEEANRTGKLKPVTPDAKPVMEAIRVKKDGNHD